VLVPFSNHAHAYSINNILDSFPNAWVFQSGESKAGILMGVIDLVFGL